MSYFADLTPYAYDISEPSVLCVGWLGRGQPYPQGKTPKSFRDALHQLVERPILLHRGHHVCEFCKTEDLPRMYFARIGNGQIRVQGQDGVWYAAPTMIYHYVEAHAYQPPSAFIAAVQNPMTVQTTDDAL